MRGDSGVAGEGELLVFKSVIPGVSLPCHINEYQLRLDVQRFFWPVCSLYYAGSSSCILGIITVTNNFTTDSNCFVGVCATYAANKGHLITEFHYQLSKLC